MRRTLVSMLLGAAILLAIAAPASAGGVSPASLTKAGWNCVFVTGAVHCFPPATGATSATIDVLVFAGSNPSSPDAPFLGTEHLIRVDLFAGEPCPTDPPGQYTDLRPILGIPYYACHHYDSPF